MDTPETGNLRKLETDKSPEVKRILEHALTQAEGFEQVVVIAMKKQGNLWMRSTSMTLQEKAHLCVFHQAFLTKQMTDSMVEDK